MLLEEHLLDLYGNLLFRYDQNQKIISPYLTDILLRSCSLFESFSKQMLFAHKLVLNNPNHLINSGKNLNVPKSLEQRTTIVNYISHIEENLKIMHKEVRMFSSRHYSDVWANSFITARPFSDISINKSNFKAPEWWNMYNNIKHEFYRFADQVNLEIVLNSLAGLFLVTSLSNEMRSFLVFHKHIVNNKNEGIRLADIGYYKDNEFIENPNIEHYKLQLRGFNDLFSDPALVCKSKLFLVEITGPYMVKTLWSGFQS